MAMAVMVVAMVAMAAIPTADTEWAVIHITAAWVAVITILMVMAECMADIRRFPIIMIRRVLIQKTIRYGKLLLWQWDTDTDYLFRTTILPYITSWHLS